MEEEDDDDISRTPKQSSGWKLILKNLLHITQIVPISKQVQLKKSIFALKEVNFSVNFHTQFVLMEHVDVAGILSIGVLCCCCCCCSSSSSS
jgi:hypothetical protein